MRFKSSLPSCCSVGFLYNFGYWQVGRKTVPEINSTSGTFIAIFHMAQKPAFDKVCESHTLLSAVASPGYTGPGGLPRLAICVFKKGKK